METRIIIVDKAPIWKIVFDGDKTIFKSKPGGSFLKGAQVTGNVRGAAFMLDGDLGLRLVETAPIAPPPASGLVLAAGSRFIIHNGDVSEYESVEDVQLKAVVK